MRLLLVAIVVALSSLFPLPAMAAAEAFPPTAPGVSEFKDIPAGLLLRATSTGDYFSASNGLFRPLFSTISRNDISMTTPVEAEISPGSMVFWVAPDQRDRVRELAPGVVAEERPARKVASRGARGGYSRENFVRIREELLAWLATQPGWVTVGEPYAVYWNGPFTPGPFKRFEVHVEVRPAEEKAESQGGAREYTSSTPCPDCVASPRSPEEAPSTPAGGASTSTPAAFVAPIPSPAYPSQAMRDGASGRVEAIVTVCPHGRAERVVITRSPHPAIAAAAARAWLRAAYVPATRDGTPVASLVMGSMDFRLQE